MAYVTAHEVPIVVPWHCNQYVSLNWNVSVFITSSILVSSIVVGKCGGSSCLCSFSHLSMVSRPCGVSMFVYIKMASADMR